MDDVCHGQVAWRGSCQSSMTPLAVTSCLGMHQLPCPERAGRMLGGMEEWGCAALQSSLPALGHSRCPFRL